MKGRTPLLLLLFLKNSLGSLTSITSMFITSLATLVGPPKGQNLSESQSTGCAPSLNGEGGVCHNRYSTYNAAELSPQTGKQPFNPGGSTPLSPGACDPTTSSFFHSPDDVWLSARPRRSSELSLFVCCHPGNCLQDLHWHRSICPKTS